MPTNWVVSSHAWAQLSLLSTGARGIKLAKIPAGVNVHFFSKEKVVLPVSEGWDAYYYLMGNPPQFNALANLPHYEAFDGVSIPDYRITGDDTWTDRNGLSASGVFIAGDTFHQDPRTRYVASGDELTASAFFAARQWAAGDNVFWLACREWG